MKSKQFIFNRSAKYKNIRQTIDGISFDSKAEAGYYLQLKLEQKAGEIKSFERQVSLELRAWHPYKGGVKVGTHIVDFLVTLNDGTKEFREVKGFATDLWKYKMKIVEANYPEIPYRVVRG